jgi:hypothetical protein
MDKKVRIRKSVSDLGQAAYVKMHGFKCIGRKTRNFYFEMDEDQSNEFDQLSIDYANSPMHDFDSCIMSLKKLPEYLSNGQ